MIIGNAIFPVKTGDKKPIEALPVGSLVKVNENGVPAVYYLADKRYLPALNGRARHLFVRKELYCVSKWNESGVNAYAGSTIDELLNNTVKSLYDENLREAIGETVIPYTAGNGETEITDISRSVFLLSLGELGSTSGCGNDEGEDLPSKSKAALKIAYLGSEASEQWLRTPRTDDTTGAFYFTSAGKSAMGLCTEEYGVRPCFTLPALETVAPTPDSDGIYTLDLSYSV